MKRFALVFAAFAALPLAACGGSEAPAVQEARVEEARLKDFVAFFPKPLTGWKAGQPVFSTADDKSSVSVSQMTDMGDIFTMTITFSNAKPILSPPNKPIRAQLRTGPRHYVHS